MPALIFVLVVGSLILGLAVGIVWTRSAFRDDRLALAEYRRTFLRRKGRCPLNGAVYDVLSADGGETWRNVEDIGDGKMLIKGPADDAVVECLSLEVTGRGQSRGPSLSPVGLLEARSRKQPRGPKGRRPGP